MRIGALCSLLALLPVCAAFTGRVPTTRARLYSDEALAALKFSKWPDTIATEDEDRLEDGPPRWLFRASQAVFGAVQASPLYPSLKAKAIEKMKAASNSAGVDWEAEAAALAVECDDAALVALVAESGVETPEYYVKVCAAEPWFAARLDGRPFRRPESRPAPSGSPSTPTTTATSAGRRRASRVSPPRAWGPPSSQACPSRGAARGSGSSEAATTARCST